ncbi:MAG: sigma-70 family RNA polymerase sigma factor [Pseudohongiellaceae bacterium]
MNSGKNSTVISKTLRYERLVYSLHQDLYRYSLWICKNPHLAEDMVQETFLRAWRSLDSLKNEAAAKSWLFTILRREHARLFERYRPDMRDIDELSVPADDRSANPDHKLENEQLISAIEQLDQNYREPLLLQVLGGFSGKEIAAILELNNNTVMTRLFRARNQLMEKLQPQAQSEAEAQSNDHKFA